MELEAKEHRLVILGLKKLLDSTLVEMESLAEDDDERVFLANDAALIDTMVKAFEEEYRRKFER